MRIDKGLGLGLKVPEKRPTRPRPSDGRINANAIGEWSKALFTNTY